jgi:branched-chain amino acid transport system ATP-binding protein
MALEAKNIEVRFGGVVALRDVSMSLSPGRIFGAIGPNGSGKSTLFNAISGFAPLTAGQVAIDGRDVSGLPPEARFRNGLARSFQTPRFDPQMTVEETVMCGFYSRARSGLLDALVSSPRVRREEREFEASCRAILKQLELADLSTALVGEIPMGKVRLVEVARAIAGGPKYVLLDEPAAGLSRTELSTLADVIHRVADLGVGVFLVEHNFHLVKALCESVLVLNRGSALTSGRPQDVARDPEFIKAYLGSSGTLDPRADPIDRKVAQA